MSAPLFESLPDTGTQTFGLHRPTVSRLRRLEGTSPDIPRDYRPQHRARRLSIFRPEPYDNTPATQSPRSHNVVARTLEVARSALSSMPILGTLFGGESSVRSPPSATWDFQPSPEVNVDNSAFMSPSPESPLPNRLSDRGDDPGHYKHKLFAQPLEATRNSHLIPSSVAQFPRPQLEPSAERRPHPLSLQSEQSSIRVDPINFSPIKRRMIETSREMPQPSAPSPSSSIVARRRPSIGTKDTKKGVVSVIKTIEKDYWDTLSYNDFKSYQQRRKGILGNEIRRLIQAQKLTLTSRYIDYEQAHRAHQEDATDRVAFKPTINPEDEVTLTSSSSSSSSSSEGEETRKKKRKGILKTAKVTSPRLSPRRASFAEEPVEILEKRRSSIEPSADLPEAQVSDDQETPVEVSPFKSSVFDHPATLSPRRGSVSAEPTPAPVVTPRPDDSEATSEEDKPEEKTDDVPWWKRNVGNPEFAVTPDFTDSFAPNANDEAAGIKNDDEKEATPSFGLNSSQQPPSLFGALLTPRPETTPNKEENKPLPGIFGGGISTQPATSIFGASGGSIFGAPASEQKPMGQSLFSAGTSPAASGLLSAPKPTSTSLFGDSHPAEAPKSASLFGSNTLFGAPKPSESLSAETSSVGLFGTSPKPVDTPSAEPSSRPVDAPGLFGTKPAGTPSSLFAAPIKPVETPTAGLFGAPPTETAPSSTLFGGLTQPAETPSQSLFGSATKPSESPTRLFGAATKPAETPNSLFGAPSATPTSLFGTAPKPAETPNSIFGGGDQTAPVSLFSTPSQGGTSLFGGKPESTGLFAPSSQTNIFGNPVQQPSSLFGKPMEPASPAPSGGLFGSSASPNVAFQPPSQTSLFGTPPFSSTQKPADFGSQPTFSPAAAATFTTPFGGASPSATFQTPSGEADNDNPFVVQNSAKPRYFRIKRKAQQ